MKFQRIKPRQKKFLTPKVNRSPDIVKHKVVSYVVKTGEGETDFVVKNKVVESERVNRQKEMNLRAKGHSVYEVIDRFLDTGDASLFNKGSSAYLDVTKLPKDGAELNERLLKACEVWDKLPKDLKGDMTLTEFVNSMSDDKIMSYLKSVETKTKSVETKIKSAATQVKNPEPVKKEGE